MKEIIKKIKMESKCEVCNFKPLSASQLVFDHLDPSTKYTTNSNKKFGVSDMITKGYSKEKIYFEISKCRILCANCHAHYTNEIQQPNKKENK